MSCKVILTPDQEDSIRFKAESRNIVAFITGFTCAFTLPFLKGTRMGQPHAYMPPTHRSHTRPLAWLYYH